MQALRVCVLKKKKKRERVRETKRASLAVTKRRCKINVMRMKGESFDTNAAFLSRLKKKMGKRRCFVVRFTSNGVACFSAYN